jgi:BirA family biotin operon repressor/biotin-[acetyl-CoA-carboxylase] ligase
MTAMSSNRQQDAALLGALFSHRGRLVSRAHLVRGTRLTGKELEQTFAPYIDAGYPIEFHPQGGIRLQEPPDIWCAEEIIGRTPVSKKSTIPGWDPLLLAETSSTNDVAREQARKGARSGFVVAAARQTAGRGRLGRAWESPLGGGLYVSLVLRPKLSMSEAGRLTIVSSLAAADAVESLAGRRPQIKWPNDLLLTGCKLAGVLIEAEHKGSRLDFAVIGMGLNVNQVAEDFSPELRGLATSLRIATGRTHRRADLLVLLLQHFEKRLGQPFDEVREAWAASSLTLGQRVTLTTARGRKHGQALGLDESGALLLRLNSGEVEPVSAGDMQAV